MNFIPYEFKMVKKSLLKEKKNDRYLFNNNLNLLLCKFS